MIEEIKNYIINPTYGGLGDHLFYSPIPRLIKEENSSAKVFLSSKCNFRNWQTYELVWSNNPYIDGITSEPDSSFNWNVLQNDENDIDIMTSIALKYIYRNDLLQNIKPEIHYDLSKINVPKIEKAIDINYISYIGGLVNSDLLELSLSLEEDIWFINPPKWIEYFINNRKIYNTKSLFEYTKILSNTKKFICLTSGGATLASALGISAVVYYGPYWPVRFMHNNIEYRKFKNNNIFRKMISQFNLERNHLNRKVNP